MGLCCLEYRSPFLCYNLTRSWMGQIFMWVHWEKCLKFPQIMGYFNTGLKRVTKSIKVWTDCCIKQTYNIPEKYFICFSYLALWALSTGLTVIGLITSQDHLKISWALTSVHQGDSGYKFLSKESLLMQTNKYIYVLLNTKTNSIF